MNTKKNRPRIIYNDDNCGLRVIQPPHSLDQIASVVDYLRNSQVDCVCWFMASDVAYSYNSEILDNINDLYARDSDFAPAGKSLEKNLPLSMHRQKIDYMPSLIDRFHAADILFYASIRMNDVHQKSRPHGWLASDFWKKHQNWRLWEVEDGFSYYNAALDYSYPEVRKLKIATVKEILERYEIDGIELDFCRNPFLFQPSEAWNKRQIITGFIAEIKMLIKKYSELRKHNIGLIIRVPFENEKLKAAGMDIMQWLNDGLPDILVMSFLSNNYNATLEPWLSRCRAKGVLFYPSIESYIMLNNYPKTVLPHGVLPPLHHGGVKIDSPDTVVKTVRAMATNYLAQLPDGIYMFNYPCQLFEWGGHNRQDFAKLTSVLNELGSLKTMTDKEKLYFFCHHLPIYVEANRPPHHHQTIRFCVNDAELSEKHKVVLGFRRVAVQNPHSYVRSIGPILPKDYMHTVLNGKILDEKNFTRIEEEMETIPSGFSYIGKHEKIKISLKGSDLIRGENFLSFHIPHFPKEDDPYVYIYELYIETWAG